MSADVGIRAHTAVRSLGQLRRWSLIGVVVIGVILNAAIRVPPASAVGCVGDCNDDGMVSINELIVGVNIALGSQPISACGAFDCQGTGIVPINCLIQGVNSALDNCQAIVTPTVGTVAPTTPTATPTMPTGRFVDNGDGT